MQTLRTKNANGRNESTADIGKYPKGECPLAAIV